SGRFLCRPDTHTCNLQVQSNPFLTPRNLARRPEDEGRDALNLHGSEYATVIHSNVTPPVTIRELRLALQDEWAAMPQQLIDAIILSMGRRCETCLAVRGDHIPY
ncbi:hypothetical protein TNCV_1457521, partial [Trichonephila clavipes]